MGYLIAVGSVAAITVMIGLWWLSVRARNFSYVDLGWALNFIVLALICGLLGDGDGLRRAVLAGMYAIWGARLSLHLARRIVGHPEEGRYVELRRRWSGSGHLNRTFLLFFLAQALLDLILAAPLFIATMNPAPTLQPLELGSLALWAIALSGESLADAQLARFKSDPANKDRVCEVGLWRYSRHPNYFFEWLIWVAYAAFALASPYGWMTLPLPFSMLYLLLNVTGVKPTEEQALRTRGETYRNYQARVSAFVPLPRRDRTPLSLKLLERGLLPDRLIRFGIRRYLRQRLNEEDQGSPQAQQAHLMRFIAQLRESPVATHTREANQQHYEVPSRFFQHVLGPHLKYSCGYFRTGNESLADAEAEMLAMTVARARLDHGQRILELGCGWGSLTLYMAERFSNSHITAVSNSRTQREFILQRARERGLRNIEVITCDANALQFPAGTRFDRVVSVEMFEHMRNYQLLMQRIASWLKPAGTLFVHIFTHREYAYPFEVRDASDWMAKYFFSGGIMPSDDLLLYFQEHLRICEHWQVDGRHYQETAEAWLQNMDRSRVQIMPLFDHTYGDQAQTWWHYWRVFFMACAELWGYRQGREWFVSHYLFEKPA
jgi:cyclopropane-fatty-acyl-phospholipid synthase